MKELSQHPSAIRAREYRRKYPERWRASNAKYISRHPDKYAEIQRNYLSTPLGRAVKLLNGARRRAKEKRNECTITREWVRERIEFGFCEITGIKFDMSAGTINRRRPFSPSIDRIDNTRGYTPDNCRLVISAINVALNEWGDELFTKIASAYLENARRNNHGQ